jgi:hypothetical protein
MEKGGSGSFHMISHSEGQGGFDKIISTKLPFLPEQRKK